MANVSFFAIFREKLRSILFFGFVASAVAMVFIFVSSPAYEVRTDYLITQEEAGSKDYYTLARSAEYMGKIFGEVAYSERFVNAAIDIGKVDKNFFPTGALERLDAWRKMVNVEQQLDLGIIRVTVYNDNQKHAMRVSQAISQVMTEQNGQFLGTGDKPIPVSILSGPIIEQNPSLKEIISAVAGGFFFGILLSALLFFLKYEVFRKDPLNR